MKIILTGLRGSGKTKIGRLLAEKLNLDFIDLDEEITKKAGKSIPEIIKEAGWPLFRKLEHNAVLTTESLNNIVISPGGGAITFPENAEILKQNSTVIYLHVSPEICANRIANSTSRPPLTDATTLLEEMHQLYLDRDSRYRKTADIIFERSDDKEADAENLAKEINCLQPQS